MWLSCRYPSSLRSHTVGADCSAQRLCLFCCSVSVFRSWVAPHTSHRERYACTVRWWQNSRFRWHRNFVWSFVCRQWAFKLCLNAHCLLIFPAVLQMMGDESVASDLSGFWRKVLTAVRNTALNSSVQYLLGQYGWPPVSWKLFENFR